MVSKALSVRRAKAGSLLKTIREVNALKVEENDVLVGHGYHTAGSLPPWPLDAVLPPYRPPPCSSSSRAPAADAAELPPPAAAAAAELPPPAAAATAAELPPPPAEATGAPLPHQPHHWHQYNWNQCPHHHFACCHPGRCHHHPHGSHSRNQAAEVRDEARGEEEDKDSKLIYL